VRIARIAAIGGALAIGALGTLALGSPAHAAWTGAGLDCGQNGSTPAAVSSPAVAVPGTTGTAYPDDAIHYEPDGTQYSCQTSLKKTTDTTGYVTQLQHVWTWVKVTAPTSTPSSAPASVAPSVTPSATPSRTRTTPPPAATTAKPTRTSGVTQTCSITTDIDHTRINGGITETCMNINGTMQWGKGSKNVNQTCMIATDINKSRVKDGVNETCVNETVGNGPAKYMWHPTDSNVTQACAIAVDLNRVRVQKGITYTCDNLTGKTGPDAKYGWHKAGNISQTCTMDVDLSHTTITGDVNVTCVNTATVAAPVMAWMPPMGQKCPAAEINGGKCVDAPVLYETCPVTGKVYVLGDKQCACQSATKPGSPAGTQPQVIWVPQDQGTQTVVPITEAAQTGSLPVTGDSTVPMALMIGGSLVALGVAGMFVVRRRNRVRFTV